MVNFGQRLKELRVQKNLTQEQLSNKVGLTKSVISAYESSARYPSYDILIKLSAIFGVTTDFLLCVSDKHRIDISGLTEENQGIICNLVDALKEK